MLVSLQARLFQIEWLENILSPSPGCGAKVLESRKHTKTCTHAHMFVWGLHTLASVGVRVCCPSIDRFGEGSGSLQHESAVEHTMQCSSVLRAQGTRGLVVQFCEST